MSDAQGVTVGELASMAGVTVRTLHHYDEIGLVSPERRSGSGYRLYGHGDVQRLQEVLYFRELGFALGDIGDIMAGRDYDRTVVLTRQRLLLEKKAERVQAMLTAIDAALAADQEGIQMSNEDMLEVFDGFDPSEYEEEAKQRWGESEAYRQSAQRTAQYTKADWQRIKAEVDDINQAFLDLMASGTPADSDAAKGVAARHRAHITEWFYDCTPEIHAGLGQMYVADARFTESIDKAGEGLAEYMSKAIAALHAA